MVIFKSVQRGIQRRGYGANLPQFGWRHMVEVPIDRAEAMIARLDTSADTVKPGHEQSREDQVHRRFVARYQALVAIGGGGHDAQQSRGMCQQPTDIVASQL